MTIKAENHWWPDRPHTLVVACSDGRLQEATDEFLHGELGLLQFDRFYVPGGGGALSAGERDHVRAENLRRECNYLITLHQVERVILLVHGPHEDEPLDAICADYRRKMPVAKPAAIREQQDRDIAELIKSAAQWAGTASVEAFRVVVHPDRSVTFHGTTGENIKRPGTA